MITQAPPPDLALEIDITSSSFNQFDLYPDLSVSELWIYDGRMLDGKYVKGDRSGDFSLTTSHQS